MEYMYEAPSIIPWNPHIFSRYQYFRKMKAQIMGIRHWKFCTSIFFPHDQKAPLVHCNFNIYALLHFHFPSIFRKCCIQNPFQIWFELWLFQDMVLFMYQKSFSQYFSNIKRYALNHDSLRPNIVLFCVKW